jgi:Ser/Thr protein kinase RdoA (MazF antagonist)
LSGGYQNEVWRSGDFVVRVEQAAPESVVWEHGLVGFLGQRIAEVAIPVEARDGSTFVSLDAGIVSVWPYIDGAPARRRHRPHALAAAELLARLHDAAREWQGAQRPGARPVPGSGVRGPIHGDFCGGNVLVRRGRVVGLVDWEESWIDLFEYELANAVWQFCCSKRENDFDRGLAVAMLDAYGSARTPHDLVPLIVARLRYERDVWGAESDEPYRNHVRRSLEKLGG